MSEEDNIPGVPLHANRLPTLDPPPLVPCARRTISLVCLSTVTGCSHLPFSGSCTVTIPRFFEIYRWSSQAREHCFRAIVMKKWRIYYKKGHSIKTFEGLSSSELWACNSVYVLARDCLFNERVKISNVCKRWYASSLRSQLCFSKSLFDNPWIRSTVTLTSSPACPRLPRLC